MKKKNLLINLSAAFILISFTSGTSAQDFAQWRGNNRDGIVIKFKVPQQWPQEFKQQWEINVGFSVSAPVLAPDAKKYTELARIKVSYTPVYTHPLLSGKFIYIKDKENLTAYSTE